VRESTQERRKLERNAIILQRWVLRRRLYSFEVFFGEMMDENVLL